MKALILTRQLKVCTEERELVEQSSILKIAVNHAPVKSDYRVFHDYSKWIEFNKEIYRGEKLVTVYAGLLVMPDDIWLYYKPVSYPSLNNDKNEIIINHTKGNADELYFYCGSIIPTIDLSIRLGVTELLIMGDNTVHSISFQEKIKEAIKKLKVYTDMYCFKAQNNFDLPYKNLKEFTEGE